MEEGGLALGERLVAVADRRVDVQAPLARVDEPERYLVFDRWESAEAYNTFLAEHQDEYLRRSDEGRFHYVQELRFGTFENVWDDEHPAAP